MNQSRTAIFSRPSFTRWLVRNKIDMIPPSEREGRKREFVRRMRWKGPVFEISALTREGCEPLIRAVYEHVASVKAPPIEEPDVRFTSTADAESEAPAVDPTDPRFR